MDEKHAPIYWDTPLSELAHGENPDHNSELYHWKYIKREKVKGKWRYYYDLPSAKNDVKSMADEVRNKFNDLFDKPSSVNTSNNDLSEFANRAQTMAHKYIAKVPTNGDEHRYFYSTEAYEAYLNGKNTTDATVDKATDKKLGALISDVAKDAADKFLSNILDTGFGKAVFNLVLPALTAAKVAAETPRSFDDMKRIDHEQTNDEHQKAVNPSYDPYTYDYSYNCSFCTAAYDLRKRGYDVEAMPISILEGPVIEDILSWYKGAKAVSEDNIQAFLREDERYSGVYIPDNDEKRQRRASALTRTLETYGDGARGHLCMYWRMGGGHDIVWEVEKGEVVFRDCQTNEVVDIVETLSYVQDYSYIRVDNCELNEEVLRTVRNRK